MTPVSLASFKPFSRLPEIVLRYLGELAEVRSLGVGETLFARGTPVGEVGFLLKGCVELRATDGSAREIAADAVAAREPLGEPAPLSHDVVATRPTLVALLPRELLENIRRLPRRIDAASDTLELPGDGPENALFTEFHQLLRSQRLELPSLPDVALRIGIAVDDPDTELDAIVKLIQVDPALAARIVGVVNSPAYRGVRRIENIKEAVTRLGRVPIRNLVLSFVLKNLFRTEVAALDARMTRLWDHSCRVAALCHVLAGRTPGMTPDNGLLAGLIHDIGLVPILSAARHRPELLDHPKLFDRVAERMRAPIGALVLRKWRFSDHFIDATEQAQNWLIDRGPKPTYTDLVIVAQLHAQIGRPQARDLPRLDLIAAFHKLALGGLTPRLSLQVLEQAEAEIREVEAALKGAG